MSSTANKTAGPCSDDRYVQGHDFRTQQIEVLNGTCFIERLLGLLSGDVLHVKILKVQPAPKDLIISEMPL